MAGRVNSALVSVAVLGSLALCGSACSSELIPGIKGQAYYFDGDGDYINIDESESLDISGNEITISAWINAKRLNKRQVIAAKTGWGDNTWLVEINPVDCGNGKLNFFLRTRGSETNFCSNDAIRADRWYYVAFVYNGTERIIYINGEFNGRRACSGNINTNDQPVRIGSWGGLSGAGEARYFNGVIDEVAIFNRALSAYEIQELYHKRGKPQERARGLVGYWSFDAGEGGVIKDGSGNHNDGKLKGKWQAPPESGPKAGAQEGLAEIENKKRLERERMNARELAESFVAASLAGEGEKAAKFAHPESDAANRARDVRRTVDDVKLEIVDVYADEKEAYAVSAAVIKDDAGNEDVLVFNLVKENGLWLINNVDLKAATEAKQKRDKFLAEHSEAKAIAVKQRTYIRVEIDDGWGKAKGGLRCRWVRPSEPVVAGGVPTLAVEVENASNDTVVWGCRSEVTLRVRPWGGEGWTMPRFRVQVGPGVQLAAVRRTRRNPRLESPDHRDGDLTDGFYQFEPGGKLTLIPKSAWLKEKDGKYGVECEVVRYDPHPDYKDIRKENVMTCPPLSWAIKGGDVTAAHEQDEAFWGPAAGGLQVRMVVPRRDGEQMPILTRENFTARLEVRNTSDQAIRLAEQNNTSGDEYVIDEWLIGLYLDVRAPDRAGCGFFRAYDGQIDGHWYRIGSEPSVREIKPGETAGFNVRLRRLADLEGTNLLSLRGHCGLRPGLYITDNKSGLWHGHVVGAYVPVIIRANAPADD